MVFGKSSKPNILSSTSDSKGRKTVVHGKTTRDTTKGGDNKGGGKKSGK